MAAAARRHAPHARHRQQQQQNHNSGVSLDDVGYLSALHADSNANVEIIRALPKYSDPAVQRQEEKLRLKGYLTFDRIFNEPTGFYLFKLFLTDVPKYTPHKALFVRDVDTFKHMRFKSARLKVARLIFQRYIGQSPLPTTSEEKAAAAASKKKQGKKGHHRNLAVNVEETRPSVFEMIQRKAKLKSKAIATVSSQSRMNPPNSRRPPRPRRRRRRRSDDYAVGGGGDDDDLEDDYDDDGDNVGDADEKSPPSRSWSRDDADPPDEAKSSDQFDFFDEGGDVEVGVTNDIEMFGDVVNEIAEHINRGSAPKTLFNTLYNQVRDHLLGHSFPDFLESEFFEKYVRTKTLEDRRPQLEDFEPLRLLGKGGFGSVYAVRKIDSGQLYAMKVISKRLIVQKKAVAMTMLERHTLSLVHSRFVCGLAYAFQNEESLFLVMDLMAGGDLKYHLTKAKSRVNSPRVESRGFIDEALDDEDDGADGDGADDSRRQESSVRRVGSHRRGASLGSTTRGFDEARARFHAAEILLGLEAMHAKNIIFRDLKLENVLLNEEGHARLTDLGLVALYGRKKVSHYAGTPGYIAPEVAQKRPYGPAVDLFSLGVTTYRMLSGKKPFIGQSREDFDKAVCTQFPSFDRDVFSPAAIDLIKGLLEKNPKTRLGCGRGRLGIQAVKDHPWFDKIDWGLLEVGYLDPPFVPSRTDINASTVHEKPDEKKKYEGVELTDKFHKQTHGFSYVSKHAVRKEIVSALEKERELEVQKAMVRKGGNTKCCVIV